MLKKIKFDNYVTFVNPTEIDFSATNYKFLEKDNVGANRILKGALFVGENASGKTYALKAINLLLRMLFDNADLRFNERKSFYTKKEEFYIEYTFDIDGNDIFYKISFKKNKIVGEKLIVNKNVVINRLSNTAEFKFNKEELKRFEDLSDNLLFLRRIYFDTQFYDDKILNKWFEFMKNSIYINCYNRNVVNYNNNSLLSHKFLEINGVKELNDFLKKIKYNQEIKYSDEVFANINGELVKAKTSKKMVSFKKDNTKVFIPEFLESTGNKTLIELLPSFMYAVNNNCMLIVDEFSSGFHNELEEVLMKYFYHYSKNSQLFFTSHSTNIINNSLIRPDQIYSFSFKGKEGTVIKRFSAEMPRESQNTEKMYLNGVFDGMPRYNKTFKD